MIALANLGEAVKWLTPLFILLLAAIVIAADRGRLPGAIAALYAFPGGDQVGHFVLMGGLAFLVNSNSESNTRPDFATAPVGEFVDQGLAI